MKLYSFFEFDLNEASQETLKELMDKRQYYMKRAEQVKKLNVDASEKIKRLKERESVTKNELTKKIYQERIAEEGMNQQYYVTRMKAIEQKLAIIEKQMNITKLRIQSQTQKKMKR